MKDDDQLLTHVTCLETALTVDNDHAHFDRPSKIPTTLQQCDRLPPADWGRLAKRLPMAGRHARVPASGSSQDAIIFLRQAKKPLCVLCELCDLCG